MEAASAEGEGFPAEAGGAEPPAEEVLREGGDVS